jgi:hypothetical protein
VRRHIDIKLGCNFIINSLRNSDRKLEVIAWKNGKTDLCGFCSFCSLLADSIQRSVESDLWHFSSKLDPILLSRTSNVQAEIEFEVLEYQKDSTPWAVNERGLQSVSAWDVYLLLLTGNVLLHTTDLNAGWSWKEFRAVLAFELFGEENDPVAKSLKVHRRPLHGPRLSDQNIAKMNDWIKDCNENHERCWADLKHLDCEASKAAAMNFLPDRSWRCFE